MAEPKTLLECQRFRVERREETVRGRPHAREVVVHPGAAVIVPVLDDGRVLLVTNRRIAVHQDLLELPAGTLDPGESAADCARRELAEETGYRADKIEPLLAFYASPGILTERMQVFVATGLRPGKPELDEGEDVRPSPMSLDEALAAIRDGRIEDGKTIAGILYYQCFRRAGGAAARAT